MKKFLIGLGVVVLVVLISAYIVGSKNMPSISFSIPALSSGKPLSPGPVEVTWKVNKIDKVTVALVDADRSNGESMMLLGTSGPLDALTGSYTMELPITSKNVQIWIMAKDGTIAKSETFTIK